MLCLKYHWKYYFVCSAPSAVLETKKKGQVRLSDWIEQFWENVAVFQGGS